MNFIKRLPFVLLAISFVGANGHSPETLVFIASTPCDGMPRTMLSIPAQAECEFIRWNLTLERDPRNQTPTSYRLTYTYGMTKPSTKDFLDGGTTAVKEGKWSILKGPGNREMYRLNPDTPEKAISFTKLNDSLLHLLDPQEKLMIGNAGWSYTLNRKK